MRKVKVKEIQKYVEEQGGTLVRLTNGNYNIRSGGRSRNIGKPDSSGKWGCTQLKRAWGDSTGIAKPRWL